jgi:hypothetical protein
MPARGLPQRGCWRRHVPLQGAWWRQTLPAGGLHQASRLRSWQCVLQAMPPARTARRCAGQCLAAVWRGPGAPSHGWDRGARARTSGRFATPRYAMLCSPARPHGSTYLEMRASRNGAPTALLRLWRALAAQVACACTLRRHRLASGGGKGTKNRATSAGRAASSRGPPREGWHAHRALRREGRWPNDERRGEASCSRP